MTEQEALSKMVLPSMRRKTAWRGGIIQIWVTRSCDKACFGCTQGSNLRGSVPAMTPELFEQAVLSLQGYWGVVGVFGGNPATSKYFDEICDILAKHVPFEQRGLWCNNPLGHGKKMRETFNPAVSNLNVHLDQKAFDEFKRDWPESRPFGLTKDSRHAPPYVAIQDVGLSEAEMWEKISQCDVNRFWSAMVGAFRGEARAWFCELAGAQAIAHQHEPEYPDTGLPATPGWWRKPLEDFANQMRFHCRACGIPLRGYGSLAVGGDLPEQVSKTHEAIFVPKKKDRDVQVVTLSTELGKPVARMTEYIQNADKKSE